MRLPARFKISSSDAKHSYFVSTVKSVSDYYAGTQTRLGRSGRLLINAIPALCHNWIVFPMARLGMRRVAKEWNAFASRAQALVGSVVRICDYTPVGTASE